MKPALPVSNSLEELLHIVSNPEVFQSRVTELKALNLQLAQRLSALGVVDEINTMALNAQARLDEAKVVRQQADEYASKVRSEVDAYRIDKEAILRSKEEAAHLRKKELDVYSADLNAKQIGLNKQAAELQQQKASLEQSLKEVNVLKVELSHKRDYLVNGIAQLQDFVNNG